MNRNNRATTTQAWLETVVAWVLVVRVRISPDLAKRAKFIPLGKFILLGMIYRQMGLTRDQRIRPFKSQARGLIFCARLPQCLQSGAREQSGIDRYREQCW